MSKVNNFSSSSVQDLPRITERRPTETGRGGKASDAGVKVCVFGATGFLGRYVCSGLGAFCANSNNTLLGYAYCSRGIFYFCVRGGGESSIYI